MRKIFFIAVSILMLANASMAEDRASAEQMNEHGENRLRNFQYVGAIEAFEIAVQLADLDLNKGEKFRGLINLGRVYMEIGDPATALTWAEQAKENATGYKQTGKANALIGNIFLSQQDLKSSMTAFEASKEAFAAAKDHSGIASSLNNIGIIYSRNGEFEIAEAKFHEAMESASVANDKRGEARAYGNLGILYKRKSEFETAADFYRKAAAIEESIGDSAGLAETYLNLGVLDATLGDDEAAIDKYHEAMKIAEAKHHNRLLLQAYDNLSAAYERLNRPRESLEFMKNYLEVRDSLFNEENQRELARLQAKFNSEKKERELQVANDQIKQQRLAIILGSIGIGLVLLLFWIAMKRSQDRKQFAIEAGQLRMQRQLAEFEGDALRLQMNPHFLFNSLTAIGGYIYEKSPAESNEWIGKFAKLMRTMLENSGEKLVAIEKDLEALQMYIELEQLRTGYSIEYQINDDTIVNKGIMIPPMLIQPFVENAINHGLATKENGGRVKVSFSFDNNKLNCFVEDNGIGRGATKSNEDNRQHATEITERRMKLIWQGLNTEPPISFEDLKDASGTPSGTKVILNIPFTLDE